MNDKSLFKVEKEGFVASLTLNRPEKRNAMNIEFFEGLREQFRQFDEDPEVWVVGLIKAEEALRINFTTHTYDDQASLYQEAGKLAREIAACSPLAVQGVKDVMRFNREHGVQAGLEYVAQKNAAILISEDLMEAVQAFMEKRPPQFKGK